ncbi:hypothetical protein CVT26_015301 [Gymnopilus dilepis]|uniref:Uncharacterized protein n=1 Tax=Gymnopilus dilepis TaxID=231916 RepID=A0A409YDX6_9AGAR|nr:hypothetical protein CVT26_015301 [Gymnopilus dilepis]
MPDSSFFRSSWKHNATNGHTNWNLASTLLKRRPKPWVAATLTEYGHATANTSSSRARDIANTKLYRQRLMQDQEFTLATRARRNGRKVAAPLNLDSIPLPANKSTHDPCTIR